jgi:hypothetical protein
MGFKIDRTYGQNYADNIVNSALLFDGGTWTVASGTGTATLDTNNFYVGLSGLKIENNTPASSITVTNSSQDTVITGDGGKFQFSWYAKKDRVDEIRSGAVLLYKNAVLLDTQSFSIGSDTPEEDINDTWVRFQSSSIYTLAKNDIITFQFRLDSATTAELTTTIWIDGVMLNQGERQNTIVPTYNKPKSLKSESFGIYDYNDSTTSGTPINLIADTWTLLTNDGAGVFTNKTYALNGVTDVFSTSTNSFDFSDLELGDSVDIRIDLEGTTTAINQDFDVDLVLAFGTGDEYRIPFITEQSYKAVGAHPLIRFSSIYIGNAATLNNSARFEIRSNDTATVVVNGWYCRVNKRLV